MAVKLGMPAAVQLLVCGATHAYRVAFRDSAVNSDMAAVVEEGRIGGHLPASHCPSGRQEVVGNVLGVQPGLKGMPLQTSQNTSRCLAVTHGHAVPTVWVWILEMRL